MADAPETGEAGPERERAEYARTLVYAGLLGVPVAFAAVLFQTAIHDVIHLVWEVVPDWLGWNEPAWWYVVLVPGLAGLLVAGAVRLPGHGGHSPLEGIAIGDVRFVDLGSILLAALATLGLGLVLGPEAPLIAIGLALGALAARVVRMEGQTVKLLVLAGAFAAIAALFGGALVAALLLFEMVAMSGMIPARQMGAALLPGFVAAGSGGLVFTGVADWSGLHQQNLSLPGLPAYETVRIADLAWCVVLSAAVAAVVVAARHGGYAVARRAAARPVATLVLAGLLVGVLAVVFRAVTDRPVDLVLFSGQSEMPALVAEGSAGVLLLVVAAKAAAYALSLGAGFRGGPVFPGIAIGAALALAAAALLPGLSVTPAVAMGIAAGTAAILRAPFSAALLSSLLVGSSAVEVAPLSVLAAAVAVLAVVVLPDPKPSAAPAQ
ncbi:MAG: chloride channel protein [Gaiella sp.]|nr:chloride channel protein [Gaiella sp.]